MGKLISFRGALGAGKSVASNYLMAAHGFEKVAFADALKIEIYDAIEDYWHSTNSTPEGLRRYADEVDAKAVWPQTPSVMPPTHRQTKIAWVNDNKLELRPLLQWWGTEYRRAQNPNYWVDQWHARTNYLLTLGHDVTVDDGRFDNELNLILDMGGVHIFIATNPEICEQRLTARDGAATKGIVGHASEQLQNADDPRNAFVIQNNGPWDFVVADIERILKGI